MGEKAITSHANGIKHKQNMKSVQSSVSMDVFVDSSSGKATCSLSSDNVPPKPTLSSCGNISSNVGSNVSVASTFTSNSVANSSSSMSDSIANSSSKSTGIKAMLQRDEVTRAEILWCLHLVRNHTSQRSGEEAVELFPKMFHDSEIAKKMKLHRTKIGYMITYGLAPHFFQELNDLCAQCDYIVIGFDESLNKVAQSAQMDIFVRFWDASKQKVITRYYNSTFLGHTTASDLLKSFEYGTKDLNLRKLLQVSSDSPRVNLKFLKDLQSKFLDEDVDRPILLNLGTCGLHHVHNAYKKAMKKTNWKIMEFLRVLYYLFLHVPARREDYTKYSGSTIFPLKFCTVRWVENFSVAGRALQIIPHVRKYVEGVKKDKIEPKCNSYLIVSSVLKDKLLTSKLAFFQTIAGDVEPFLTIFQTDAPLAPLLYECMLSTLRTILTRFVKDDVLEKNCSAPLQIDLTKTENLKAVSLIDIGYSTRNELRKIENLKPIEELQLLKDLRKDCRSALLEFYHSLTNNSPLVYKLTKGISCFDPSIAINSKLRVSRLDTALDIFVETKWLSGRQADLVKNNLREVWKRPFFDEKMKNFSIHNPEHRLDDLWFDVIPNESGDSFAPLIHFLKMVLILSNGNAFVERGFNINKETLIENLKNESLVGQRRVYDALQYNGKKVHDFTVNKSLIHAARNSHDLYDQALKREKAEEDKNVQKKTQKRQTSEKLKEIERKKKKVLEDARQKVEELDTEMKKLRR